MRPVARSILAASLGAVLAACTVQAQSITGLEKGRQPSPTELLAELQGHGATATDSAFDSLAALERTAEVVVAALEQPLKTHGADHFTRDQLVALKVAMQRAEAEVRDVAGAVASGELPPAEGRARVVQTLSEYGALLRELQTASASSSASADRR